MSLNMDQFNEIIDRLNADIDPDMSKDDVFEIVEEIVDEYGMDEPTDLVTLGIFVGDIWRPVDDEEIVDEPGDGIDDDGDGEDD